MRKKRYNRSRFFVVVHDDDTLAVFKAKQPKEHDEIEIIYHRVRGEPRNYPPGHKMFLSGHYISLKGFSTLQAAMDSLFVELL